MRYRFAEFVLDVERRAVLGPDGQIPLRPRAYELLRALVVNAPALLSHERIRSEVWGHEALSGNVLPQLVGELRQALSDSAQSPRLIETRPRLGYRLLVAVTEEGSQAADGRAREEPPRRPRAGVRTRTAIGALVLATIAALIVFPGARSPLEPANDLRPVVALTFADSGPVEPWIRLAGIELVTIALAKGDRLELLRADGRGRGADLDQRWQLWLREGLGARYALTGVWSGTLGRVVLDYGLVDLRDGRVLHGGRSEGADIAVLARSVAEDVRRQLRVLPPSPELFRGLPGSPGARSQYYAGLAALSEGQLGLAIENLEGAAAAADAGVPVWSSLGRAYLQKGDLGKARLQYARVLEQGTQLDLGERLRLEAEWALSEHRTADAIASLSALERLLPGDRRVVADLADALLRARRPDAARALLERQVDSPGDPQWLLLRSRLALASGDAAAAAQLAEQAVELSQELAQNELLAQARLHSGRALRSRGDLMAARSELENALLDTRSIALAAELNAQLGSLHRDLGDFPTAVRYLDVAAASFAHLGNEAGSLRIRIEQRVIDSERGQNCEAYAELLGLEPEVDALDDPLLKARLQNTLGVQAIRNAAPDLAREHLQRAAVEARRADQPALAAGALSNLGQVLASQARRDEAALAWQQALQLFVDLDDRLGQGITMSNLAALASISGKLSQSRELNGQALTIFRSLNAGQHLARTAFNLGLAAEREGDLGEAIALFEEALATYRAGGAGDPVLSVAAALIRVLIAAAEPQRAQALLEDLDDRLAAIENPLPRSQLLAQAAILAELRGDAQLAEQQRAEVARLRAELGREAWLAQTELEDLAALLRAGGYGEVERARAERLALQFQRLDDARAEATAWALEAELLLRLERREDARASLQRARAAMDGQADAAVTLSLDRLAVLVGSEPIAARRARLEQLASRAPLQGHRLAALRLRLEAWPDDAAARIELEGLGLPGALPVRRRAGPES